MNRWTGPLLFVAIAAAAGCAMDSEPEADAIRGGDTLAPMGLKLFPLPNEPVPDTNRRAECLNIILTDPRIGCIFQGLGVGGAQTLQDQINAAVGCNCTAEIVTSEVPGAEGIQRVAMHCPGDPEFFGIFSPPPLPANGEPPFIGIHINPFPDDIDPRMCDVTLTGNGVGARQENENCSKSECHGQHLRPKWYPSDISVL